MGLHWSLSDNSPSKVSRILLNILTNLINVVSLDGLDFFSDFQQFQSLFLSFRRIQSASTTIETTVTLMSHSFFQLFVKVYIFHFSFSFIFTLWSGRTAKSTGQQVFFVISHTSGILLEFYKQQIFLSLLDYSRCPNWFS